MQNISNRDFAPRCVNGLRHVRDLRAFTHAIRALRNGGDIPPVVVKRSVNRQDTYELVHGGSILAAYETCGYPTVPIALRTKHLTVTDKDDIPELLSLGDCIEYKQTDRIRETFQLIEGLVEHNVWIRDRNNNDVNILFEMFPLANFPIVNGSARCVPNNT